MRYFYIKITSGNSNSTFKIYYENNVSSSNLALKYNKSNNTTSNAIGITYQELTGGDGVLIQTPDDMRRIILEDETDSTCTFLDFTVGPSGGNITITDASCEYGTVVISGITGGTSPYVVSIQTQEKTSTGNTVTFSSVVPGIYVLTISDFEGRTYQIPITIEDNSLSSEIEVVQYPSTSSSSDGTIKLISSGGTYNKTLKILKNNNYPNTIECGTTLVQTITGVTGTTTTVTGLTCGAYCLQVTDANNCVVNSKITEFCATPIQPPVQLYSVNTRYGITPTIVCSEGLARRLFSASQRTLVEGGQYYVDRNNVPYEGGNTLFKNPGIDDCNYGQISGGVFTVIGTCSPCA
jgi:hypothetical protein